MGLLVDGQWKDQWYPTEEHGGRFVRQDSAFRDRISAEPGSRFPPEAGRYHLYVAWACPWAHRVVLYRTLKGLEDVIPLHVVAPEMLERGWVFDETHPDGLYGLEHLYDLYRRAMPRYTGRVTVPVLWDTKEETIVNNESSELIRMFDAFAAVADASAPLHGVDMVPEALRSDIDEVNAQVYDRVNNGVYKAGFATTQAAYEAAVGPLFETLDWLEARLGRTRYLAGERITEADWRLFPTILRFDPVYHGHFKCNLRRIADYPNLLGWLRELAQWPGVPETIDLDHIKGHYYRSHPSINPSGVVPVGLGPDLWQPHGRHRLAAA